MSLSPTTFATGINEKLAAIDIYSKKDSSIASLNLDFDQLIGSDLAKYFKADMSAFKDLKIIIGKTIEGIKVDIEALKKGILSATSGLMGLFNSLPEPLRNALLKTDGFSQVRTTLNGVDSYIKNSNYSTISALAELIKGISGCEFPIKIQDDHGRVLLSTNLIKESSNLGLFGAYTSFINCISDKYFGVNVTKALIPHVIEKSDYNLLKEIADNRYSSVIAAVAPTFIKEFSEAFKLPVNIADKDHLPILNNVITSFGKLNDDWSVKGIISNVGVLGNISKDFSKLFETSKASAPISTDSSIFSSAHSLGGMACMMSDNSDLFNFSTPVSGFLENVFSFF